MLARRSIEDDKRINFSHGESATAPFGKRKISWAILTVQLCSKTLLNVIKKSLSTGGS